MKNPSDGVLGAWNLQEASKAVKLIAGKKLISATVGDVPMQADKIYKTLQNFNQTGINYIKIALTSSTDLINVLKDLPNLRQLDAKIIAVFFADYGVNITLIEYLSRAGFSGVMLDTAKKKSGSLVDFLNIRIIENFLKRAKKHQLLSGLAGSLQIRHVPTMLDLRSDVLGFRGALCGREGREGDLCQESLSRFHRIVSDLHRSNQNLQLRWQMHKQLFHSS